MTKEFGHALSRQYVTCSAIVAPVPKQRLCVVCRQRPVPPKHKLYCSNVCRGLAKREGRKLASTPFAHFLQMKLAELNCTQGLFARKVGVSPPTVTRWLQGGAPLADAYERLKAMYGDEVPVIATETDRRRAKARENLCALNAVSPEDQRERAQRGGAAGKGKPKPAHSEKMREWHASEAAVDHRRRLVEDLGPRLTQYVTSDGGRALVSLGKFLENRPDATLDELRSHAMVVARRLHPLTSDAVFELWKPTLRARGYPVGKGRPRDEELWRAVDELVGAARNADGRLPDGSWSAIAEAVGRLPEQAENLRRSYNRARQRGWAG